MECQTNNENQGCAQGQCAPQYHSDVCTGQCGCTCMGCMLTRLAKEAKMNLLVRKMEAILEKKIGKKLDREAEVVVEHALAMWKMKMENKMMKMDEMEAYGKKLMASMKD